MGWDGMERNGMERKEPEQNRTEQKQNAKGKEKEVSKRGWEES